VCFIECNIGYHIIDGDISLARVRIPYTPSIQRDDLKKKKSFGSKFEAASVLFLQYTVRNRTGLDLEDEINSIREEYYKQNFQLGLFCCVSPDIVSNTASKAITIPLASQPLSVFLFLVLHCVTETRSSLT
jgi:hypothetical protein